MEIISYFYGKCRLEEAEDEDKDVDIVVGVHDGGGGYWGGRCSIKIAFVACTALLM